MSSQIVCRIGIDQYSSLITFDPLILVCLILVCLIGFLVASGKLGSDPSFAEGFFRKSDLEVPVMDIRVLSLSCTVCLLIKYYVSFYCVRLNAIRFLRFVKSQKFAAVKPVYP